MILDPAGRSACATVSAAVCNTEDVGYMILTSGSTGTPKGVLVPNRAVHHLVNVLQDVYGFEPGDRFSKAYNLGFDGSAGGNAGTRSGRGQLISPERYLYS
jgi:acyl-coenzyme A synthetase/AMP-(fatty) acid ligase